MQRWHWLRIKPRQDALQLSLVERDFVSGQADLAPGAAEQPPARQEQGGDQWPDDKAIEAENRQTYR